MDIMSMKGTRTLGRRSMPYVMRGKLEPEPGQTLKMSLWIIVLTEHPCRQVHCERTKLQDMQEVWLEWCSSYLWRWATLNKGVMSHDLKPIHGIYTHPGCTLRVDSQYVVLRQKWVTSVAFTMTINACMKESWKSWFDWACMPSGIKMVF